MSIGGAAEIRAPGTQAGYAHQMLRLAIVTGEFRPGDRILQADLAKRLEVSVTPIREALHRLEEEGLVESAPHRGTVVAGLDLDRAEQIYAMRMAVEPLHIRRTFGRATEADLREAREIVDAIDTTDDLLTFNQLDERFHALTQVLDDSPTANTLRTLAGAAAPYVFFSLRLRPEQIRESNANHRRQVAAVVDGDMERFIALELEHLESTISILRKLGSRL